jgi:hypothetical protein
MENLKTVEVNEFIGNTERSYCFNVLQKIVQHSNLQLNGLFILNFILAEQQQIPGLTFHKYLIPHETFLGRTATVAFVADATGDHGGYAY